MMTLSDKGTLLLPVARESLDLRAVKEIDGTIFVPKAEHHITVFGYRTGKLLLAAMKEDPNLRANIDACIDGTNWEWKRTGFFFVLERDQPKPLSTVIELVKAPIAILYGKVAFYVDAAKSPELVAALASPPPPHITLYTTDKKGVDGIGVDKSDDLKLALNACSGTKFRARSLPGV